MKDRVIGELVAILGLFYELRWWWGFNTRLAVSRWRRERPFVRCVLCRLWMPKDWPCQGERICGDCWVSSERIKGEAK